MNQKTLNDIANQEFANMKKVVDQTPKNLEKLWFYGPITWYASNSRVKKG